MNTYYNFLSLENEDIETARAYYLIEIVEGRSFKFCASPLSPNEINADPNTRTQYYWPMYYASITQSNISLLFPSDPADPDNPIKNLRSETLSRDDIHTIFGIDPTIIKAHHFGHVTQSQQVIESLINSLTLDDVELRNYIRSVLLTLSLDITNRSEISTVIQQTNHLVPLLQLIVTAHPIRHPERSEGSPKHGTVSQSWRSLATLGMTCEQLQLINSLDLTIQSLALDTFRRVILEKSNDDISFCSEYLQSFIALLSSDQQNIRRDATYLLYRLAQNDQNKNIIRHQNGIPALVALLADSDALTYYFAQSALRFLSSKRSNRKAIIKADALPALMNGLHSDHPAVVCSTMIALSHFLMDANTFIQHDILTCKNISEIVSLLGSYNQETVRHAACTLNRIAFVYQHRITIFDVNGLIVLIDLLRTNTDIQTTHYVIATLFQFSNDSRFNTTLIRHMQHTTQLSMLLTSPATNIQYYATVMLQNLSCHDESRFFSQNIINRLINLLSSRVDRIASGAAYALGNLAWNDEKQRFIVEGKGIPLFFDLLKSSSMKKKRSAIYALSVLSLHANHHAAIFSWTGIEKIMCLLTSCDTETKVHALYALGNLAKNPKTLDITYDRLIKLISLLTEKDHEIQRALTYTLSLIMKRPAMMLILHETQSISSLIHLLTSSDRETRRYAAKTLSHISFHHENKHVMSNSSNIQLLIDLLISNDNTTKDVLTQRYVTNLLSSLACVRQNKQFFKAHGIKALISILDTGDILTTRYAVMALRHLAMDTENQIQIGREHGLVPLISLLSFSDTTTQCEVVKALAILSINISNQNMICGLNAMNALRCLINSEERSTRRFTLLTISNLTRHPLNAVVMREANIIEALLSCLFFHRFHTQISPFEKDELLIKHYAFIALKYLARDKDNQQIIKHKISHISSQPHLWNPISKEYLVKLRNITELNSDLIAYSMFRDVPSPDSYVDDLDNSIYYCNVS